MNSKLKFSLAIVLIAFVLYFSTKSTLEESIQESITERYTETYTEKWQKDNPQQRNLSNPVSVSVSLPIKVGEGKFTSMLQVKYNVGSDETEKATLYIIANDSGDWQASTNPFFFTTLGN